MGFFYAHIIFNYRHRTNLNCNYYYLCRYYNMDTMQLIMPGCYALAIGVKVLLPPHSNNKIIKLLEAECDLFTSMVSRPTINVAPIEFDPAKYKASQEMVMTGSQTGNSVASEPTKSPISPLVSPSGSYCASVLPREKVEMYC